jgi:thiol-disulfide isomerase/thioredoxin
MSHDYENAYHIEASDFNLATNTINGVTENALLIVKANWCGHCKEMKKKYEYLASMYPKKFLVLESTHQDRGVAPIIAALQVKGFPTIFHVGSDGKVGQQYNGGRDVCSLLKALGIPIPSDLPTEFASRCQN